MRKPCLSIFYLLNFLIFSLSAMTPEQNHRIQQSLRSLNIRQVKAVLQELNNNLTQAEYQQLRNIMDNLPQRSHINICQKASENCMAALIGCGIFGILASGFHIMVNPKNKEDIKNIFDKINHYIPKSLVYAFGTASVTLGVITFYYLGKNIRFYISGKRYGNVSNLLARTNIQ